MANTLNQNTFRPGTPTRKVRTANLEIGDHVVATPTTIGTGTTGLLVRPCGIPNAGVVRTVDRIEIRQIPARDAGRAVRVYSVYFTDGTVAESVAPLVNWFAVE